MLVKPRHDLDEIAGPVTVVELMHQDLVPGVTAGACFHFSPGTVHRVTALEDTTILEVSTPHLDDVVRLEDRYGREGTSDA